MVSPSRPKKPARKPGLETLLDFEVQRCTRRCASTGRAFEPGEVFYSVLEAEGSQVLRRDYSAEDWQGPPNASIGWWKSHMPSPDAGKLRWAPNDVMLNLFLEWAEQPQREDIRYVLTLLLVRRRVMRIEDRDAASQDVLRVYCPRREESYQVAVAMPDAPRVSEIQDELAELLFADAA